MNHRLYTFVNHLYMNAKQWGIQTAHCVSTMSVTYKHNTEQHTAYLDWATNEPTIIMCEGGNVAMLTELYERLKPLADSLNLAIVKFHEDEQSLGGVITSVAVLIPEDLYNTKVTKLGEELVFEYDEQGAQQVITQHTDPVAHAFLSIVKTARLA